MKLVDFPLMAACPDPMIVINGEGAVIASNPAAQTFFGFNGAHGQGAQPVKELYDSEAEAEAVAALLKQRPTTPLEKLIDGYRTQVVDQSGMVHPMLLTATAVNDEPGGDENIICHFRDITETEALTQKVQELSRTDFLTGMYNFKQIFESLDTEISRSIRYMHPFALICFSVRGLAIAKEQLGALTSDEILKSLASITHGTLRGHDSSFRQSTTEFLALCPETDVGGALRVAERLRDTFVATLPLAMEITPDRLPDPITLDLGVTVFYGGNNVGPDELIEQAVQAMVQAKRQGNGDIVLHKVLR